MFIAAIVPGVFGLVMMLAPDVMLGNSLAVAADTPPGAVTQWVGFGVFSLACINYLSRSDYDYMSGVMKLSGMVSGVVPHTVLAVGFAYYLLKLGR